MEQVNKALDSIKTMVGMGPDPNARKPYERFERRTDIVITHREGEPQQTRAAVLAPPPPQPAWFKEALAAPWTDEHVEAEGCAIHYVRWTAAADGPAKRVLCLVHGGEAHAHWWDHVAPFLIDDFTVVALDFSGHGESGHREHYTQEKHYAEILEVCNHAAGGAAGALPPIVVGHSMGGGYTLGLAKAFGDQLGGAVCVDSAVHPPGMSWAPAAPAKKTAEAAGSKTGEEEPPARSGPPLTGMGMRAQKDEATIYGRYKLINPGQHHVTYSCPNKFIVDHMARNSYHQIEDGTWRWKFDGMRWGKFNPPGCALTREESDHSSHAFN